MKTKSQVSLRTMPAHGMWAWAVKRTFCFPFNSLWVPTWEKDWTRL